MRGFKKYGPCTLWFSVRAWWPRQIINHLLLDFKWFARTGCDLLRFQWDCILGFCWEQLGLDIEYLQKWINSAGYLLPGLERCSYTFPAPTQLRVDLRQQRHKLSFHNINTSNQAGVSHIRVTADQQLGGRHQPSPCCVWWCPARPVSEFSPRKPGPGKLGSQNSYLFL